VIELYRKWGATNFYGSGLQVPVPSPTIDHKKHSLKKELGKNLAFFHGKLFYQEEIDKFHQIYCKM
jgi:hypothetical protein